MQSIAVVVNGDSMWPTLKDGETISALPYHSQPLEVGDIVVFYDPRDESRICIKRLKRIESDGYFVEGDNPDPTASSDSHNYGLIDQRLIIGFKR
ncbi:MAG: S26 family signal peptidase [Candidatus Poseidoniaceae archaeon]|nr:S26 family signal peptidase [Candidatus Poseidoniaceae archaeon]